MVTRELAWGDFAPLVESYLALYEEVRENPDLGISLLPRPPTWGEEAEWFAKLFSEVSGGKGVAVVADVEGRAVGICHVGPKGNRSEDQNIGNLGISVARAWRGKGLGREMMRAALERCRGKFEIVELAVFASNTPARALYSSLGFREWGTEPRGVRRGGRYTDVVHMTLGLKGSAPT